MTVLSWRQSVMLALVAVAAIVLMGVSAAALTEKSRTDDETPVVVVTSAPITVDDYPLMREVHPLRGLTSGEGEQ